MQGARAAPLSSDVTEQLPRQPERKKRREGDQARRKWRGESEGSRGKDEGERGGGGKEAQPSWQDKEKGSWKEVPWYGESKEWPSYEEGRWRPNEGEPVGSPLGEDTERQSEEEGRWRSPHEDQAKRPSYEEGRWGFTGERSGNFQATRTPRPGEPRKRPGYETGRARKAARRRQQHTGGGGPSQARPREEEAISAPRVEDNTYSSKNGGSHRNRRLDDAGPEEGETAAALELGAGAVAICTLYYVRLRKERCLREQQRRRRLLLFRRSRARERLRFAVLWAGQLLAGGGSATAGAADEEGQERRIWSKTRSSALWDTVMEKAFSNFDWTESFRMTKSTFDYLCGQLRPAIQRRDTNMRRAIPTEVRLAMTLWRLGSSCEYRTIEKIFGVSRSTICKIVRDVCEAVVSILTPEFVHVPRGEGLRDALRGFEGRHGLPQLAGVVGALHVAIRAPNEGTGRYFNAKGWHSVVLQAVVDSELCFWDLNIGCPGNLSDSQVLLTSELYEWARGETLFPRASRDIGGVGVPIHLLGGRSYPLLPWLMTPFGEGAGAGHVELNRRFSSALGVAPVAFGRLKSRWRCLLKRNDTDLSFLPTLIAACCTLHNVCEARGDPFEGRWLEEAAEEELEQPSEEEEEEEEEEEGGGKAAGIRNALVKALLAEI